MGLKIKDELDEFLISLKEYGFEYIHDPLNREVRIKGEISYININTGGTVEISLTDNNRYLSFEMNHDSVTVRIARSDRSQGISVKEFMIKGNVRIYSYSGFGYLTIAY